MSVLASNQALFPEPLSSTQNPYHSPRQSHARSLILLTSRLVACCCWTQLKRDFEGFQARKSECLSRAFRLLEAAETPGYVSLERIKDLLQVRAFLLGCETRHRCAEPSPLPKPFCIDPPHYTIPGCGVSPPASSIWLMGAGATRHCRN